MRPILTETKTGPPTTRFLITFYREKLQGRFPNAVLRTPGKSPP